MPTVILGVISFAAFATGAVVVRRRSASQVHAAVTPVELLIVSGALLLICVNRGRFHSIYAAIGCALVMSLVGGVSARLIRLRSTFGSGGTREFEDFGAAGGSNSVWRRWLSFTRLVVDYEVRLLLVGCYLVMVGPIALAFRFARGTVTGSGNASNWVPRSGEPSLESARRPF
jgi:hypothetical protein